MRAAIGPMNPLGLLRLGTQSRMRRWYSAGLPQRWCIPAGAKKSGYIAPGLTFFWRYSTRWSSLFDLLPGVPSEPCICLLASKISSVGHRWEGWRWVLGLLIALARCAAPAASEAILSRDTSFVLMMFTFVIIGVVVAFGTDAIIGSPIQVLTRLAKQVWPRSRLVTAWCQPAAGRTGALR